MAGGLEIRVEAPATLDKVTRTLRSLGEVELAGDLEHGLERIGRTLTRATRKKAADDLPSRGGLGTRVARSRVEVRRARRRGGAGVTIAAEGMKQLKIIDEGRVRHPVWGNRDVWVSQKVTSGWFSEPVEDHEDDTRRELERVLADVARRLARKLDSS
jgi:hypothetical protein